MKRVTRISGPALVAAGWLALGCLPAPARSGSRYDPPGGSSARVVPPGQLPLPRAASQPAPLALEGNCPVCRVNLNQLVPGKPEISTFYQGLRYLFPGAEQRRAFLAHAEQFVAPSASGSAPPSGSTTRPPAGSGSGGGLRSRASAVQFVGLPVLMYPPRLSSPPTRPSPP